MKHLLLTASLLALASVLHAGEPTADADALVAKLADPALPVRRDAKHKLVELGAPALAALQRGLATGNDDVKSRCREVLAQIAEKHIDPAVDYFRQTGKVLDSRLLPGYERWTKLVGEGEGQRKLLAGIYQTQLPVLRQAVIDPKAALALFEEEQRKRDRTPLRVVNGKLVADFGHAETLGLLLVMSEPALATSKVRFDSLYLSLLRRERNAEQLLKMEYGGSLIEEMFAQIDTSNEQQLHYAVGVCKQFKRTDDIEKRFKPAVRQHLKEYETKQLAPDQTVWPLSTARELEMPEVLPLAIRCAKDAKLSLFSRMAGIMQMAKWGGKQHLATLTPLLSDEAELDGVRIGDGIEVASQVRDLALAASVHLSGQKLTDYPFAYARLNPDKGLTTSPPHYWGFEDDKQRQAAFAQYRTWADKHAPK